MRRKKNLLLIFCVEIDDIKLYSIRSRKQLKNVKKNEWKQIQISQNTPTCRCNHFLPSRNKKNHANNL